MSVFRPWAAVVAAVLVVAPAALGQVNIGANFQSQKMTDNTSFNVTPPDTTGSVGPGHFMQYNNGRLTYFNKDGSTAKTGQLESAFWLAAGLTSTQANSASGDPRLQFDPLSGRWFATAFTTGNNNSIYIARSDSSDPTSTWKAVTFATTIGRFCDYPTLGFDRNGVYIGTNNFNGNTLSSVSAFSIPKADLLLAAPTVANMTRFEGQAANTVGFTLQGVANFNPAQAGSAAGQIYAISNNAFNQVKATPVNNPGGPGAATLGSTTNITVVDPALPPTAKQPNAAGTAQSTTTLDTISDRIQSRIYRVGDRTYFTFGFGTTASPSRAAIDVVVLNSTNNAVIAQATIAEVGFDYYIPSIAANARGDVVVGYTRSGFVSSGNASNRWPSSYVSVGTLSGSTLTFGTPIELRTGATEYLAPTFDTANGSLKRWGDYSATNLDSADPGIFWTTQEFAFAARDWGTQASEVIPTVAGEKRWASINATTPAGITGPYATAANWYNGAAPTATDHVIFSRNGNGSAAYTVTMPAGSTSTDQASVRQGSVVWSIPSGAAYSLTNLGTGASDASGNVTSAASLAVADYLGAANLTVSGGGTLNTATTTIAAGLNSEGSSNVSSGSLTISGAGTTWNNSLNAYVGGNSTREGGSGSLTVTGGAAANVAGNLVVYNRAAGLTANAVAVGAGSTLTASGLSSPGAGTVTPTVSLSAASSQLVVSGGSGTTFSGVISGPGSLTKSNAGTFTLAGANTYTGPTAVTGGTLKLAGSGSFAASPTVTVGSGATLDVTTGVGNLTGGANFDAGTLQFALASGQTLQGTGTANAGVTARAGSGVRGDSGTGTGTLTVSGTAALLGAPGTGGATLTTVVSGNGTTSPAHSTLATTTVNLVANGTNKLNFLLLIGSDPNLLQYQVNTAVLATATLPIQVNGVVQLPNAVIDPTTYNLTAQGLLLDPAYQLTVGSTAQTLELTFTPVPEPGAVIALAAAGLGLIGVARRRKKLV